MDFFYGMLRDEKDVPAGVTFRALVRLGRPGIGEGRGFGGGGQGKTGSWMRLDEEKAVTLGLLVAVVVSFWGPSSLSINN
jgi:hypothetical protein